MANKDSQKFSHQKSPRNEKKLALFFWDLLCVFYALMKRLLLNGILINFFIVSPQVAEKGILKISKAALLEKKNTEKKSPFFFFFFATRLQFLWPLSKEIS